MEVHTHHSHNEKSTWKTHFKEFFMLFLAVFCGSMAEYYMEHKVENERAEKYMTSLVRDLKTDSAMMQATIEYANKINGGLDSVQNTLYHFTDNAENVKMVYRQNFTYLRWLLPDFTDNTATQLRYSGNFRLIKKGYVADSISSYWIETGIILRNANLFIEKTALSQETGNAIFNRQFVTYPDKTYIGLNIQQVEVDPNAKLMTTDKNTLIAYANRIGRMTDISKHYLVPLLKDQIEKRHTSDQTDQGRISFRIEIYLSPVYLIAKFYLFMPLSFYLIATSVFLIISVFLYRVTAKYLRDELSMKSKNRMLTTGAMRGILPISLVFTVLIMLAVQHYFY